MRFWGLLWVPGSWSCFAELGNQLAHRYESSDREDGLLAQPAGQREAAASGCTCGPHVPDTSSGVCRREPSEGLGR